ncbi:hypothetical protein M058_00830 [Streptococcus mitis 17/34]|nr:hypothetical protein M058_00830 [Streptococcus mitis 17/34]
MPTAGSEAPKILPRPLLNWQAFSVRWGFIGQERLGFGAKPQEKIYWGYYDPQ